jgi:hypothetical protein
MLDVVMIRFYSQVLWNSTAPLPKRKTVRFYRLWICHK